VKAPAAARQKPAPAAKRSLAWLVVPGLLAAGAAGWIVMRPSGDMPPNVQASRAQRAPVSPPPAPDAASPAVPVAAAVPAESTTVPATRPADSTSARPFDGVKTGTSTTAEVVVRRIEIKPSKPASIAPGQAVALSAVARDASGAEIGNARLTWSTGNPRVATVDSLAGTVHGVGAGATRITVHAGNVVAGVTVTVIPPAPAPNVAVAPESPLTRPAPRSETPVPSTPTPAASAPAKSEAELRAEIQTVVGTYARAIEQRDTSLIRRVFPLAGSELMTRWQNLFDDAKSSIAMTGGSVQILDTPLNAPGSKVQASARYVAKFSSKAARSDQSFPVTFTATLQRDPGVWHIVAIR
jgi:hypothetical protein